MNRFAAVAALLTTITSTGLCAAGPAVRERLVGGYSDTSVTNAEVIAAAEFAVTAQTAEMRKGDPAASLTLVKILTASQQVVAGMNYRMDLKVKAGGVERAAEAIVWWQAWNRQTPYRLTSWTWKPAK